MQQVCLLLIRIRIRLFEKSKSTMIRYLVAVAKKFKANPGLMRVLMEVAPMSG